MSRREFAEQREEALAIGGVAKDLLPVVAALDDVVWISGDGQAALSGHRRSNENVPDPNSATFCQDSPMANRRRCSLMA
jgi:hypothetical protein